MNNKSIALNGLHVTNNEKISHLYKSGFNKTRERQVIVLMISVMKNNIILLLKIKCIIKKED